MKELNENLVSVCIITWNSSKTLPDCLLSLSMQTYKNIELIVVDNASKDNSIQIVQAEFPGAKIIGNQSNLGFCIAQNMGISASEGEFFMPLNPDVKLSPNFIKNLVDVMNKKTDVAIVAGKLYLPQSDLKTGLQLLDGAGLFIESTRRQYLRGHGEPDHGQYESGEYVFGACGAAPLYRRSMLEEIQINGEYFDSTFFAHKEDLDISWRSQILGWRAWYEPTATAYHNRSFRPSSRSVMSKEVKAHAVKNRYLTIVKNDFVENLLHHGIPIIWYDLRIIGYIVLFERSSLKGLMQFIRLIPEALRKRRFLLQKKRVSATYMRGFFK